MPLHVVRAQSNHALWQSCANRFLAEANTSRVTRHDAHIWLTHRLHRDLLLEEAARQGHKGWLKPPIHFFSNLPTLFGITGKPVGLLTRRELISRLAATFGRSGGIASGSIEAYLARGHMLDHFFGELLPEGITPDQLANHLSRAEEDDFAVRRNAWVVATYRAYLLELGNAGLFDSRAIHALVAQQIRDGKLSVALDGAKRLHIYGLYSLRARATLLQALAAQNDVDVVIYTTAAASEFEAIAASIENLPSNTAATLVQPAPDAQREARWVAERVRAAIQTGSAEPHEIAVVARTGLADTRRMVQALERAGVPATARVRTPLAEISALKAVLDLFDAAADSWSYRALRRVLASPYLGHRIDLRAFDRIACDARPQSLDEWQHDLELLQTAVDAGEDSDAKQMGVFTDRLRDVIVRFSRIRTQLQRLDGAKPTAEWISITTELLRDRGFRLRVSHAPLDRYDIVRLDQRGVRLLQRLLDEWSQVGRTGEVLSPRDWYQVLRSLLQNNQLVMTTPGQKGVQVLEAHDAALVPFKLVFVVHANDGEFPRLPENHGLFTEEERRALSENGLPVEHRRQSLQRERALWHAVTANTDVVICYRTADPKGTPLLASLLVPPHDRTLELPRNDVTPLQPKDATRHAILMAHAERQRGAPHRDVLVDPYNPWNGVIRDPYVLDKLAQRFNEEYVWSASQLQKYAMCPFFFLVERVLRFQEMEEAEEDTSPLTVGGVAHDVLERFYNALKAELPASLNEGALAMLRRAAQEEFAEREREREWLGLPVLWRNKKRDIENMLIRYIGWELAHAHTKGERPLDCEFVLGGEQGYVELTGYNYQGDDVRMRLAGRIDRIDVDSRGQQHVLDYKTSTIPSASGYADGVVLQAPLYLRALLALGRPMRSGYYRALKPVKPTQYGCKVTVNDEKYSNALAIAFSIPGRVRRGLFEVTLATSAKDWPSYELDLTVRRTNAVISEGTRYDR